MYHWRDGIYFVSIYINLPKTKKDMKNSKDIPEKDGKDLSPLTKKVIIAVVVMIVLFLLLVLGQITMFIGIFNWLVIKVRVISGLDMFLARGIAAILFACLLGAPLGRLIWSFFPVPQKSKKKNRFISLLIISLVFFVSFFVSQNVFFNSETGKTLKYYVVAVDGEYKFSSSAGYDPVTGKKFKPVIKEVAQRYLNGEEAIDFPELPTEERVVISEIKDENKNDGGHKKTFFSVFLDIICWLFFAWMVGTGLLLGFFWIINLPKKIKGYFNHSKEKRKTD